MVVLECHTGAGEPGEERRTGLVKYASATAALSSNVYKHALKKKLPPSSRNRRPRLHRLALSPGAPNPNPLLSATQDPDIIESEADSIRGSSRGLKIAMELNSRAGEDHVPLSSHAFPAWVGQLSRYQNLIVIISGSDHRIHM